MRTTVDIQDNLLALAKKLARDRGVRLSAVINDALRETLERLSRAENLGQRPPLPKSRVSGKGLRAGLDANSASAITEALEGLDSRDPVSGSPGDLDVLR